MTKRSCFFLLLLFLMLPAISYGQASSVAAGPIIKDIADADDLKQFNIGFTILSRQYKVAFMVEGVPFHPELSEAAFASLKAIWKTDLPVKEAVDLVAHAYDYEPEWIGNTLCLLRKRYTEDDDLPDVTFEEVLRSLQNIRRVWAKLGVVDLPYEPAARLNAALNGEWRQRLAENEVPIKDLPPNLYQAVKECVASDVVGESLLNVLFLAFRLEQCHRSDSDVAFKYKDVFDTGLPVPIFEGEMHRWRGKRWNLYVALSGVAITNAGNGTVVPAKLTPDDVKNVKVMRQKQRESLEADPLLKFKYTPKVFPEWSTTLEGQLKEMQSDILCDKAIAEKHLCVFGETYSTYRAVIEGLQQLYGLRLTQDEKTTTLTTTGVRLKTYASEAGEETERLIPLPIPRYLKLGVPTDKDYFLNLNKRWERLYFAAMKPLRALVVQELDKDPKASIPFGKMPAPADDLVAISSIATCARALADLQLRNPKFLDRFDEGSIRITVTNDPAVKGRKLLTYDLNNPALKIGNSIPF